ncbi:MAG: hypothetical protein MI863_07685 [Desulfobacterales bacterium]|nr:hypothetical protein [Desulfobacterales bacterium]
MVKQLSSIIICTLTLALAGCSTSHEVEVKPVEIKPIHITIDVNVKVDKALDDFFGDIDAAEDQLEKDKEE